MSNISIAIQGVKERLGNIEKLRAQLGNETKVYIDNGKGNYKHFLFILEDNKDAENLLIVQDDVALAGSFTKVYPLLVGEVDVYSFYNSGRYMTPQCLLLSNKAINKMLELQDSKFVADTQLLLKTLDFVSWKYHAPSLCNHGEFESVLGNKNHRAVDYE